jgi:hypothetical protein
MHELRASACLLSPGPVETKHVRQMIGYPCNSLVRLGQLPLIVALLVALSAQAVVASNQGSSGIPGVNGLNNGVWWTPDKDWEVAKVSLASDYFGGVTGALIDAYNPTDVTTFQSTTTSCITSADTCAFDSDYGDNGAYGWNACYPGSTDGVPHPNQSCSNDWVRLNVHYVPPGGGYQYNACHELGHAIGLRHNDNQDSCVKQAGLGGDSPTISAHDAGHLNARY